MGLFGPNEEHLRQSIEALGHTTPEGRAPAERYLRSHWKHAWPLLREALEAATDPDPSAAIVASMSQYECRSFDRIRSSLPPDDQTAVYALSSVLDMSTEDYRKALAYLFQHKEASIRRNRGTEALRFVTTVLDKPEVAPIASRTSIALLASMNDAAEDQAVETLVRLGPDSLPALVKSLSDDVGGVRKAVAAVGARYPAQLAQVCAEAEGTAAITNALSAIALVGAEAKPAEECVLAALAGPKALTLPALEALGAIGPSPAHVSAVVARFHEEPVVVSELLISMGSAAHEAAPTVLDVMRKNHATVEAGLQTLAAIGPSADALPLAAEALDDHPRAASAVLCRLGHDGVAALAAKLPSLTKENAEQALIELRAVSQYAEPAVPALGELLKTPAWGAAMYTLATLGPLGDPVAPQILDLWKEQAGPDLARRMCEVGNPALFDAVVRFLYQSPRQGTADMLEQFTRTTLTGAQLTAAATACCYEHTYSGREYDAGTIDLSEGDRATQVLIGTETPATSNLLHLVAGIRSISVHMDNGCGTSWDEEITFQERRNLAKAELDRRGNPPYDAAAYIPQS